MYKHAPEQFGKASLFSLLPILHRTFMKFLPGFLLLCAVVSSQAAPPAVFIRSPTNSAVFTASPNLRLIAEASDPDVGGSVTRVDFYRGTTLIGQSTDGVFSLVWSNVPAGSYALRAVAVDNTALSTTSAVVNLTITALAANQ